MNAMKRFLKSAFCAVVMLLLVAVSASAQQDAPSFVDQVNANRTNAVAITSKMNLNLSDGNKDTSIGGNFRVKRDDVIQLSLVFLGIKEVGRLELTPDSILIVDRLNHRFCKVGYADIPGLSAAGIGFSTFQSLFWGEMFLPGDGGVPPIASEFTVSECNEGMVLTHRQQLFCMKFLADATSALLSRMDVTSDMASSALLSATYGGWTPLAGGHFPTRTNLSFGDGRKSLSLSLSLSNVRENADWETRTVVNENKYKRLSLDNIVMMITTLLN